LLRAKVVFERKDCAVANALRNFRIELVLPKGEFSDHVVVSEEDISSKLRDSMVVKLGRDRYWVRAHSCSACRLLAKANVLPLGVRKANIEEVEYELVLPSEKDLQRLIEDATKAGIRAKVVNVYEEKLEGISEEELKTLYVAYKAGYFDDSKRGALTKIAELTSSPISTVARRLKNAIKYSVEKLLKEEGLLDQ